MHSRVMGNRPVLFLDFDGVLHPASVYRIGDEIFLARREVSLFEWAPLLVYALAPYPSVQLVLSTSWVRVVGFDKAKDWLPDELQSRTLDATWHSRLGHRWESLSRYEQVCQYVQQHSCDRWVALDDDVRHWGGTHRENLVATSPNGGLAEPGKLEELTQKLAKLIDA